ncbi:MAG: DUF4910 domain-containing protein [Alphaproteobacteria bacterium]
MSDKAKSGAQWACREDIGEALYGFVSTLFPYCRSLTGSGVRQTLSAIRALLPELDIHEVPSGSKAFDWTVPEEWTIRSAWLESPDGTRVVDFEDSNLSVVSYSEPIDAIIPLAELQPHLHSLPQLPDAVPYVTSYYKRSWGFCMPDRIRRGLPEGDYRAFIDSSLKPGSLSYGEFYLPGERPEEVLISTYVCHPSMANNELSGPAVATYLARWLATEKRKFSYRFVFVPETIGTLVYLSRNLDALKARMVAGFVLTCIGDEGDYSYLSSRAEGTLADRVARHVLRHHTDQPKTYSYLERGSDERQYGFPGIDLPVCSLMRTKYGEYLEYHTSLDDLSFVTPAGLSGGYHLARQCVEYIEANELYVATTLGEPQLSRYGLYPTTGGRKASDEARLTLNVLAYADGRNDLLAIADRLQQPMADVVAAAAALKNAGLIDTRGSRTTRNRDELRP